MEIVGRVAGAAGQAHERPAVRALQHGIRPQRAVRAAGLVQRREGGASSAQKSSARRAAQGAGASGAAAASA